MQYNLVRIDELKAKSDSPIDLTYLDECMSSILMNEIFPHWLTIRIRYEWLSSVSFVSTSYDKLNIFICDIFFHPLCGLLCISLERKLCCIYGYSEGDKTFWPGRKLYIKRVSSINMLEVFRININLWSGYFCTGMEIASLFIKLHFHSGSHTDTNTIHRRIHSRKTRCWINSNIWTAWDRTKYLRV